MVLLTYLFYSSIRYDDDLLTHSSSILTFKKGQGNAWYDSSAHDVIIVLKMMYLSPLSNSEVTSLYYPYSFKAEGKVKIMSCLSVCGYDKSQYSV